MSEVQNPSMAAFTGTWVYALVLILAVLAIIVFLFDHTRFGYNYRALRDGQKVAVETGVREISNALACYAVCGALMGVVGFLNTVRNTNINGGSLNFGSISIMFTAFLPMFNLPALIHIQHGYDDHRKHWCGEMAAAFALAMFNC